jgi:hypothetical protein
MGNVRRLASKHKDSVLVAACILASVLMLSPCIPVGGVAAFVMPNLPAAGRASKEDTAIRHLLTLKEAELKFKATTGKGHFGTMSELNEQKLIDADLSSGLKDGYCFQLTTTSETFEVRAAPSKYPSDGRRSFYFSLEDGIIRAADKEGRPADLNDPPLPEAERVAASPPDQTR